MGKIYPEALFLASPSQIGIEIAQILQSVYRAVHHAAKHDYPASSENPLTTPSPTAKLQLSAQLPAIARSCTATTPKVTKP
ncbi:hypothetical protein CsSME_00029727 [Camellia sinensis var. sinensis]